MSTNLIFIKCLNKNFISVVFKSDKTVKLLNKSGNCTATGLSKENELYKIVLCKHISQSGFLWNVVNDNDNANYYYYSL